MYEYILSLAYCVLNFVSEQHERKTFCCHEYDRAFQYKYLTLLLTAKNEKCHDTHGLDNFVFHLLFFPVSSVRMCNDVSTWKSQKFFFCNKWTLMVYSNTKKNTKFMLFRSHRKINHWSNVVSMCTIHLQYCTLDSCFHSIGEKLCQYDLVACTRNKSFIQHAKKAQLNIFHRVFLLLAMWGVFFGDFVICSENLFSYQHNTYIPFRIKCSTDKQIEMKQTNQTC